ncbi:tetratricopeptide repeat protein [Tenacibaculum agarivorans]|uniref:tetratricopeptide repeat protein n=1 Tax=Tenacibaculum agarivorans TaxID=1908389 RepID=UPI00094B837A|nr:tetratricopeptide repeat protein [Tenacibaculum agarivorans]
MKKTTTLLLLLLFSQLPAQQPISKSQWQEDLRFLQQKIHKDHSFLFKKITPVQWDAEVEELYQQIPNLQEHEIKVGLSRIISLFQYGHTQIPFSTVVENGVLPVHLYHFKDGIYIEGVEKTHRKTLGAKVLKVAGIEIKEALAKIRPVVPVENDQYFKAYGLRFLTVPSVLHAQKVTSKLENEIILTLEKNGETFEYTFPTVPLKKMSRGFDFTIPNETWLSVRNTNKTPLYLKYLNEKFYFFEYLSDTKTLYVRQSSVFNHDSETLKDFYKRLFKFIDANDVEKLIYDVRLNGGGNNYNNKPLIKGLLARPKINKKGHFFYITGRFTYSACQNLTNEIENYTEAVIIGEATAENKNFYGDATKVTLPNSKINTYLSFAWWQDMSPWENADATSPHFYKEMTFDEYRTNQDPVLDLAMNLDVKDVIVDPIDHFTQLFLSGKMQQLEKDVARLIKDPLYQHIPFEKEFDRVGKLLLKQGQLDGALYIYSMTTKFYPNVPEIWKGLGRALEASGKTKEAKGAFVKAEQLSK